MKEFQMIKVFVLMTMFVFSFKSQAEVPFWDIKGMHDMVKNPAFSPVEGFLALKTGTLERIRFYGPYVLGEENPSNPQWLHPAFLVKRQDDPYAFSKRFEYPLDPIAALVQWLFPSVDGALFVANDRVKDVVGNMGRDLKEVSRLPDIRAELITLQDRLREIPNQEQLIAGIDSQMDKLREELKKFQGRLTEAQIKEKKDINSNLKLLAKDKDKVKTQESTKLAQELETQITQKIKLVQKLEFMPKILRCIHEGMSSSPSQQEFQSCLGTGVQGQASTSSSSSSSSSQSQSQDQKTIFTQILYEALLMDGTFSANPNPLYSKHIALHALLGYMWRICDNKAQVMAVMREAGLLKASTAREHRLTSEILERDRYTRSDYESIKTSPNPTFEQLAYAGYGYEIYENPNPEMIVYSSADLNPSQEDLTQYPYLSSHLPYPDCGETALRNFFNLVAFKGAGEFDARLLSQFQTDHMEKIRQFYQGFPNISSQKQSLANTAWSTIVSNLNRTPNSLDSSNPMDVRYDGYTNIKASLGMKNILNVMAKLTEDSVLNQSWRTGEESEHIAQKLTHLCQILSRGEEFSVTWEINGQSNTAPVHGDFKFIITRQGVSSDFTLSITDGHFALTSPVSSRNDWRKAKTITLNQDLLKPFYATNPSPFLDPLISEKQDSVLTFWKQEQFPTIPLTLRFLYKNFGSVINDENAQINIMKGLNSIQTDPTQIHSPAVKRWGKALLVDKLGKTNPDRSNIFQYEFFGDIQLPTGITLHTAAQLGLPKTVANLIEKRVEIEEKDLYEKTPLIYASEYGHTEIVEILLKARANIEAKDGWDRTPLIYASQDGHAQVVEMLLKAGANIEAKDKGPMTPLMLASERGHAQVVEMLGQEQERRTTAASKIQNMVRKRQAKKQQSDTNG